MQTCIVKGFVDKPGTKYYYYHGILKPCNVQPQIVCFDQVDTPDKYGPEKTSIFYAYYDVGWNYGIFNYTDAHDHATGGIYGPYIGQSKEDFGGGLYLYSFYRMGLVWDTVSLPYDCEIISAKVTLTITNKWSGVTFDIVLRNGAPTFPHITDDTDDYYYNNYSGDYGRVEITDPGNIEIDLTPGGLLLVNKSGYTKFALISSNDIDRIIPIANDTIGINGIYSNIKLTVKYKEKNHKFLVSFYKNDELATGIMRDQEIIENLKEHLNKNTFHKNGWTFTGWAETGGGAVAYIDEAFYTIGSANVTIYAKWTANLYTITFDKNNVLATGTMADQDIYCGSIADLRVNEFLLNGWYFDGWAEKTDGVVRYYDEWPYTMGVGNITLYAKYKGYTFKISFDKNDPGATGTMSDQSIVCGSSDNIKVNVFDKIGWSFIGWAEAPGGPVVYVDQEYIEMGPADITIYAIWVANSYKVHFDKNDPVANGQMDDQGILSGSSANLDKVNFSKYMETFSGWAEDPAGPVIYSDQGSYTMGIENVTLYAIWV